MALMLRNVARLDDGERASIREHARVLRDRLGIGEIGSKSGEGGR
jgi:hypothetical protein